MGEIVDLPVQPAHPEDNLELIADCCRFSEKILTEEAVRKKWHFDNATWAKLGEDENFIEKIEAERVRRIRTGQQKRERSQVLITKAPDILDAIATDANASPRHRVDAIKTLDNFCVNGPEAAPATDRFIIQINLGSDTLRFNKSVEINPNDVDPTSTELEETAFAVIAMKKPTESGGGDNTL